MKFRQTTEGKNVFLSIDSRVLHHNPLYQAWKTKSFTDGDITLHFILMDIMATAEKPLSVSEIAEKMDEYLSVFSKPRVFDESTVRKKMKEYVEEGILKTEKCGRILYYRKAEECEGYNRDTLDFFSETAPCGVIGSFLLDKEKVEENSGHKEKFVFKHHYITSTIDSEILCRLFQAIHEKRKIVVETIHKAKEHSSENEVIPLKILISVQNGRQYLMAYSPKFKRIGAFRIDNIVSVKSGNVSERFDELRGKLERMKPHIWGVSTQSHTGHDRMETVEFTVHYEKGEEHIHHRLEREKRCGTVEKIDEHTSRFYAEIYDATELIPWIRTFIGRIVDIHISNPILEAQFKNDIERMYQLYGIGDDEI